MNATPDGDYQTYKAEDGAYVREHFFGRDPRTRKMVEHLTDDEIWNLKRGGHDYRKLYAAYKAATEHNGQPTVILAKTIKGWTLGSHFEGRNATHQMKKLTAGGPQGASATGSTSTSPTRALEDNPYLPPYYQPGREVRRDAVHARAARSSSAAPCRTRRTAAQAAGAPADERSTATSSAGSGKQKVATTMAFVRLLKDLMKDKEHRPALGADHPGRGPHLRHGLAVPDRRRSTPRTGSTTPPVDRELFLAYKESEHRADPARGHQRGRLGRPRSPRPAPSTPPTASR